MTVSKEAPRIEVLLPNDNIDIFHNFFYKKIDRVETFGETNRRDPSNAVWILQIGPLDPEISRGRIPPPRH